MNQQEGASDADISILPRYRYDASFDNGQKTTEEGLMVPIVNNSGISTSERVLVREDAVRLSISRNISLFYLWKLRVKLLFDKFLLISRLTCFYQYSCLYLIGRPLKVLLGIEA